MLCSAGGTNINNYNWEFGFGTKTPTGAWNPELQLPINNVTNTTWSQLLQPKPWIVSPIIPGMNTRTPDHYARVTLTPNLGGNPLTFENANHTVTP